MASIQLPSTTLAVRLTPFEKTAGLLRDVEVPRSAVVGAAELARALTPG